MYHADIDASRCAYVYIYAKQHHDFDRIMDWDRTYFDYQDEELQKKPMIW